MKILFDINHPHQVHFFKNAIWHFQKKGYEIFITANEKDISLYLLEYYGLKYIKSGKSIGGWFSRIFELIKKEYILFKNVRELNPDILVSLTSPTLSHVAKLTGKMHIAFADTENAKLAFLLATPFTDIICTPSCFKKYLGKKQFMYNGYQELAYLHPNYFTPDNSILDKLDLAPDEKFIIMRFVAWNAHHDIGHKGIDLEMKWRFIKELEKYARVFISSELPLPLKFEPYRITVAPENIHDLMYYATLLIGESATMASECAVLGVPAIYIDFTGRGYTDEEEEIYDLVYNFKNDYTSQEKALMKAVELLKKENLKQECRKKRNRLINDKIDVTQFMIDFIENYSNDSEHIKKYEL